MHNTPVGGGRHLGVFCGSRDGNDDGVHALARELASAMVAADVGLVYGGAGIGVMGTLADAVLDAGGTAIGVIPVGLFSSEVPHANLTELVEVPDIQARKRAMYERSDAFCALPGGFGTLEEVFEAATWTQLGLHGSHKPVVLLDRNGFWSGIDEFLDRLVSDGFVKPESRGIVSRTTSVVEVLAVLDR